MMDEKKLREFLLDIMKKQPEFDLVGKDIVDVTIKLMTETYKLGLLAGFKASAEMIGKATELAIKAFPDHKEATK
jgi:hypothetical protein